MISIHCDECGVFLEDVHFNRKICKECVALRKRLRVREFAKNHPEEKKRRDRAYQQKNKDVKRQKDRQRYLENREKIKKRTREWYRNNPDKARERRLKWKEKNRDKKLASDSARYVRRRGGNILPLPDNYRQLIFKDTGGFCAKPGCWRQAVHIDHIQATSQQGPNSMDNFQGLCAFHNVSKGAKYEDYRPERTRLKWEDYVLEQLSLKLF